MGREAEELVPKTGLAGLQVTHQTDEEGLLCGQIEDPLVVFFPRAGFDDDGGGDAQGFGQCAEVSGEDSAVQHGIVFGGPWDALWPGGVVEVGVCVDDALGCVTANTSCRKDRGEGGGSGAGANEIPSGHHALTLPQGLSGGNSRSEAGSVPQIYTKGGTLYYKRVPERAPRDRSCARRKARGRTGFRAVREGVG